jgi:uroporphyrinogen decarboxylase
MNSREKVLSIFNRTNQGAPALWTGNPHHETMANYLRELGLEKPEQLYAHFGDDARWIPADGGYKHPEGKPMFDPLGGQHRDSLNQAGIFAETEDVKEVEKHPWPKAEHCDFSEVIAYIKSFSDKSVWTGMWSPFFHYVADYFGMDNYFMAMYTQPDVVDAVTNAILDFHEEANDRFFAEVGDDADVFFFGNDFGTQLDLLISPEMFERFVLPGMKRLVNVAKKYNKKVLLHSCGSIYRVIPKLIEIGVDGLHPLQARARGMEAESLAREYKNDIAFVGGVDTQQLLVTGTPQEVRDEVHRLRDVFGPNFVVSPSHEAILPNVSLANVMAMVEAAKEA